jgi:hypothetical protein
MAEMIVHNLDVVIRNIKAIGGGAPRYMNDVLTRCMSIDVWPRWVNHIKLTDHSLEDLARLGHPYSTRFGVDSFMHPDSEVHKQSGSVFESSRIVDSTSNGEVRTAIMCTSPHYIFLRYGTRFMRMRDPGGAALGEALPDIKKRFATEVKQAIVKLYVRG